MPEPSVTFENAMKRLGEIVNQLQQGTVPLEKALQLFQEGTGLIQTATKLLDEAEQKVAQLRKGPDGAPETVPFDGEDAE